MAARPGAMAIKEEGTSFSKYAVPKFSEHMQATQAGIDNEFRIFSQ